MEDNLPELRDIHLPDGVSFFPPAIGWYFVLSAIILLIVIYKVIKKAIKYSRSRYAKRVIDAADIKSPVLFAVACSEVLRRICVYKYKDALYLKGIEWQEFLDSRCSFNLDKDSWDLLINAPYLNKDNTKYTEVNAENIKHFTYKFIGENL
ncbi:MAG: DUF4381 domain-containing protein [Alphaproteobacteria bacterium]